jgi:hypothetical protein
MALNATPIRFHSSQDLDLSAEAATFRLEGSAPLAGTAAQGMLRSPQGRTRQRGRPSRTAPPAADGADHAIPTALVRAPVVGATGRPPPAVAHSSHGPAGRNRGPRPSVAALGTPGRARAAARGPRSSPASPWPGRSRLPLPDLLRRRCCSRPRCSALDGPPRPPRPATALAVWFFVPPGRRVSRGRPARRLGGAGLRRTRARLRAPGTAAPPRPPASAARANRRCGWC